MKDTLRELRAMHDENEARRKAAALQRQSAAVLAKLDSKAPFTRKGLTC